MQAGELWTGIVDEMPVRVILTRHFLERFEQDEIGRPAVARTLDEDQVYEVISDALPDIVATWKAEWDHSGVVSSRGSKLNMSYVTGTDENGLTIFMKNMMIKSSYQAKPGDRNFSVAGKDVVVKYRGPSMGAPWDEQGMAYQGEDPMETQMPVLLEAVRESLLGVALKYAISRQSSLAAREEYSSVTWEEGSGDIRLLAIRVAPKGHPGFDYPHDQFPIAHGVNGNFIDHDITQPWPVKTWVTKDMKIEPIELTLCDADVTNDEREDILSTLEFRGVDRTTAEDAYELWWENYGEKKKNGYRCVKFPLEIELRVLEKKGPMDWSPLDEDEAKS